MDVLLGAFLPGTLSEIVGPLSSGASSLLLALIARLTASGGQVAVVDALDAFDPASAEAAGADLSRLLWVKCGGRLRAAWGAADLLVRCPGFALVALDLIAPDAGPPPLASGSAWGTGPSPGNPGIFRRLQRAAEQGSAALVLRCPRPLAGTAAGLVVSARRVETRWIGLPRPTRFTGLTSELHVLRVRARSHPAAPREGPGIEVQWRL